MMKKIKLPRRWLGVALLVAIVGLLSWGMRAPPLTVTLATAALGPMQVSVKDEGVTRLQHRYQVSAPVAGFVRRIEWQVGDVIERGALVAELEPVPSPVLDPRSAAEARARLAASSAALAVARAQVEAAAAEARHFRELLQRQQQLAAQQLNSAEAVGAALAQSQRAQALLASAQFAVQVARHERDMAQIHADFSDRAESSVSTAPVQVHAPITGRVLKRLRESEGVVSAAMPLLEIGDPQSLEVAIDVLSQDAVSIRPEMRVSLTQWGGVPLQGRVRRVEPVGYTNVSALGVEEQRVWVIVDIVSPTAAWTALGDGYRVEAEFIIWEASEVLRIPDASLFRLDAGWGVFVFNAGEVTVRAIEVGHRSERFAEISAGLEAGEQVVVRPDQALRTGMSVRTE